MTSIIEAFRGGENLRVENGWPIVIDDWVPANGPNGCGCLITNTIRYAGGDAAAERFIAAVQTARNLERDEYQVAATHLNQLSFEYEFTRIDMVLITSSYMHKRSFDSVLSAIERLLAEK